MTISAQSSKVRCGCKLFKIKELQHSSLIAKSSRRVSCPLRFLKMALRKLLEYKGLRRALFIDTPHCVKIVPINLVPEEAVPRERWLIGTLCDTFSRMVVFLVLLEMVQADSDPESAGEINVTLFICRRASWSCR